MSSTFSESVREQSADLGLRELLEQPVTELIGVGPDAATALDALAVVTIFDLGASSVFARAASALAAAASNLGLASRDLLGPSGAGVPASEIPDLPIGRLHGVSPAVAARLTAGLSVTTIRELALWPPRRVAHELVALASGTQLGDVEDAAEDLRPRFGEYPTERVYYDTLMMFGSDAPGQQPPLAQPVSLAGLTSAAGFDSVRIGAIATYSQSWFAQGITLGHMVHSLALAPGEATRLAVIDWTRRTTATASESVEEAERLSNSTNHVRAISEVQNAVADEMQEGGSIATGWSKSSSKASGFAGSIGGGIAGSIGSAAGALGFGFGGSSAKQSSETESRATSTSWSVGSRSVVASMNQRVNDRTEQYATSVRNRRATAVREVSQSEHEQVSTRIVANYNHMHALTVQYYEVVQIYRVTVQLNRFERVLFVPFDLLDFSGASAADLLARFRGELLAAALTPRAAELLIDDRGRTEVRSTVRVTSPIVVRDVFDIDVLATATVASIAFARGRGEETPVEPAPDPADPRPPVVTKPIRRKTFTVTRPGPVADIVPGDAVLRSIAFEDVVVDRVRVDQDAVPAEASTFVVTAATQQVDFAAPVAVRDIRSIHVGQTGTAEVEGSMILRYESDGSDALAVVPLSLLAGTSMQKVAVLGGDASDRRAELLAHLQANRAYYTTAVLERLDSASLVLLLSGVSWQGRPLADQVEPTPVAVAGNYLVLKAPVESAEPSGLPAFATWSALLADRGVDFTSQETRLVPIPTAGVFAEAVLGRSNSAEKLDITRFWNWQDSPIPLQPPEISPVGTGTRATDENLTPGQLGAPVLTIQAPTSLPDPAGLSAALGALASAGMFRDMSGLAGTQAAAQAASAGTLDAATEAGRIASTNFQAATTQATEMGKAAANMFTAMKSSEGEKGRAGGISGDGARINHGRDLDERGVSTGAAASGGAASGGGSASGTASPSTGGEASGTAGEGDLSGGLMPGSADVMPGPNAFPRELAAMDQATGVSPGMLGGVAAALGVPVIAAQLSGAGSSTLARNATQLLKTIRQDALAAGIAVRGIALHPMSKHRNAKDFTKVGFAAWTDDAKNVYVNTALLQQAISGQVSGGIPVVDAEESVRGSALLALHHEIQHVGQFGSFAGRAPTFAEMIDAEASAYAGDVTWLADPATQTRLKDVFGWSATEIGDAATNAQTKANGFTAFKNNAALTDEAKRRDAMKAGISGDPMLPSSVRGKTAYTSRDLYQP